MREIIDCGTPDRRLSSRWDQRIVVLSWMTPAATVAAGVWAAGSRREGVGIDVRINVGVGICLGIDFRIAFGIGQGKQPKLTWPLCRTL